MLQRFVTNVLSAFSDVYCKCVYLDVAYVFTHTLKAHVARICFKCFRCFRGMLQVLHINVAKVNRDVAHVIMAIHVYFKCMFQMFHLF